VKTVGIAATFAILGLATMAHAALRQAARRAMRAVVPPALTAQLKQGGRLVLPLGPPHGDQELWLVEKLADGELRTTDLFGGRFVPRITP
jgi:protein-L-isoaspartate(D-aspartate) O-methyltransferase